ncbi:MAG: ribosome maturation factor RimP [Actinomycetota bacterium]|nr:ribosome maturation factor RimP [Actinomycetota bacterium]
MARTKISPEILDICRSAADRKHLELVDVNLRGSGRHRVLEVIVDREEGGVSIDLVADVSQDISNALDRDDYIEGSYTLEVSSAGLERPLVRPADYRRFEGREVKVRTQEPIDGSKRFEGRLRSAGNEGFELELPDGRALEIRYSQVAGANLVVDWTEELRRVEGGAGDRRTRG